MAGHNGRVTLDAEIDELYRLAPGGFTAARNELAKTLNGDQRARVRALGKPTNVAWAVNQVYWRDRVLFDRLVKAGDQLRSAQIAALKGGKSDVRAATSAQRAALADAVAAADRHAREARLGADADEVTRTLDALSLSPESVTPGRLTEALQPSGFEMLLGTQHGGGPAERRAESTTRSPSVEKTGAARARPAIDPRLLARAREEERRRSREEARERKEEAQRRAAETRRQAKAQKSLELARVKEARTRKQWEAARAELQEAEALARSK